MGSCFSVASKALITIAGWLSRLKGCVSGIWERDQKKSYRLAMKTNGSYAFHVEGWLYVTAAVMNSSTARQGL